MKSKWLPSILFAIFLGLYSIFSFSQTDPNLVLSNWDPYWNFQLKLWQLGFHQRPTATLIYIFLIFGLFSTYLILLNQFKKNILTTRQALKLLIISIIILLFSYPALSHDIFNYLLNAKMVWYYRANPHINVALDFPQEPWLKFMHNTHTPAPYAYGWTILSLIPSFIGQHSLKLALLLFKIFVILWFAFLLRFQYFLGRQTKQRNTNHSLLIFALNPLVLIETVSNGHNDVVMMALALASCTLFLKSLKNKPVLLLPSLLLLLASASIKYATIIILGSFLLFIAFKKLKTFWSFGGIAAITMFSPLVTTRSQRFLPWYLIWPLSFFPAINEKIIRELLIVFSFSSLLRYAPFLYHGEYSSIVISQRQLITFLLPLFYFLFRFIFPKLALKRLL